MLLFYLAALETDEERKKMSDAYESDKDFLYHIALGYTEDHQRAEDAVHNCYMAIIRHKDKFLGLPSGNLRALCVTIVRHSCIDIIRRHSRYHDTPIDELEQYESDDIPVEDQVVTLSEYEALKRHLDSLDQESQNILDMRYKCGLSYKEIADLMNITSKHVDSKLTRAKAKLKTLLMSEVER